MSFSEDEFEAPSVSPVSDINDDDEEFNCAVDVLTELAGNDLSESKCTKKRSRSEMEPQMEPQMERDRIIVHRMYGCKQCKLKMGHEEDYKSIHKKIDEIFKLMKQTVNR